MQDAIATGILEYKKLAEQGVAPQRGDGLWEGWDDGVRAGVGIGICPRCNELRSNGRAFKYARKRREREKGFHRRERRCGGWSFF